MRESARARESEGGREREGTEAARGQETRARRGDAATRWQCFPAVSAQAAARDWTGRLAQRWDGK